MTSPSPPEHRHAEGVALGLLVGSGLSLLSLVFTLGGRDPGESFFLRAGVEGGVTAALGLLGCGLFRRWTWAYWTVLVTSSILLAATGMGFGMVGWWLLTWQDDCHAGAAIVGLIILEGLLVIALPVFGLPVLLLFRDRKRFFPPVGRPGD